MTELRATDIDVDPAVIGGIRRSLAVWLERTPLNETRRNDVVLAVYEAMANCVEHAYSDGELAARSMNMHAAYSPADGCVQVSVSDDGQWCAPLRAPEIDGRGGRGLPLIDALSDELGIFDTEVGTTVLMQWHVDRSPDLGAHRISGRTEPHRDRKPSDGVDF